jgi:protein-tyrosine phosphatase
MGNVGASSEKMGKALKGFSDCHCHILPNLDDGPGSINESIEMARVLSSSGFSEVYCTPHLMRGGYDNSKEQIEKAALELQAALDENRITVTVHAAVEYFLDEYLPGFLDQPMTLSENVVLIEAYRQVQPQFLVETLFQVIMKKRLRPLLAHPERYDMFDSLLSRKKSNGIFTGFWHWFQGRENNVHRALPATDAMEDISKLKAMGCLFQGNIGSFAGMYGVRVKDRARRLLEMGFYDRLGTDAHRPQKLADWLGKGLKTIEQEIGADELAKLVSMPAGQLVG